MVSYKERTKVNTDHSIICTQLNFLILRFPVMSVQVYQIKLITHSIQSTVKLIPRPTVACVHDLLLCGQELSLSEDFLA